MKPTYVVLIIGAAILTGLIHYAIINKNGTIAEAQQVVIEPTLVLTHRQKVWIHALEWCESKAVNSAINKVDRDGTPSFYNFQWKPSTFKGYALRYKLLTPEQLDTPEKIMKEMQNYDTQYEIIKNMLFDKTVKWQNEFPDCVNKKIGRPPLTI